MGAVLDEVLWPLPKLGQHRTRGPLGRRLVLLGHHGGALSGQLLGLLLAPKALHHRALALGHGLTVFEGLPPLPLGVWLETLLAAGNMAQFSPTLKTLLGQTSRRPPHVRSCRVPRRVLNKSFGALRMFRMSGSGNLAGNCSATAPMNFRSPC